jgi:hypothetical protein
MFLTEQELKYLVLITVQGQGGLATEEQIHKVLDWAEGVRAQAGALDNVLQGYAMPSVSAEGEVQFQLTERGRKKGVELLARVARENPADPVLAEFAKAHGIAPS